LALTPTPIQHGPTPSNVCNARFGTGNDNAKKPRYRCIAAFHHHGLYGTGPLATAKRFLQSITNPLNAAVIAEELKVDSISNNKTNKEIPCPYISTPLLSALRVDLPKGEWSSVTH
jgi:hypothetical protein